MVSYPPLLLSIHSGPNLFPITLSEKGLSERAAAAWMSVPLSRLQPFPRSPAVRFALAAQQTGKWLLLCASLGRGGGGATVKGGRGKKTGLSGLLATSQGQQRMERQGNCPGKGSWQFYMVILDLSASWNEVKYLNIWRARGKEKRSNGMLPNHRIG